MERDTTSQLHGPRPEVGTWLRRNGEGGLDVQIVVEFHERVVQVDDAEISGGAEKGPRVDRFAGSLRDHANRQGAALLRWSSRRTRVGGGRPRGACSKKT